MTYVWVKWLADALRAEGCDVVEEANWSTTGRPSSTGDFDPYGSTWHHTGTTTSDSNPIPTLAYVKEGNSDAPGPLCHGLIGYDGSIHLIAAGRANHAGKSNGFGPFVTGDGNWQTIGWEIDYNGTQKMSPAQYDAAIRAATAVLRHFRKNESYAVGHKETSTTGKWDPGGYDMDAMRADVKAMLAGPPGGGGGDDEMHKFAYLTCSDFGPVSDGGKFVVWDKEGSDQQEMHAEDAAGLTPRMECSMSGVVEVHVTAGQVDVTVERYASGMVYKALLNRGLNLKPGYSNVPFAGKIPDGEFLYVKIAGDSNDAEVGSVRINVDAFSL